MAIYFSSPDSNKWQQQQKQVRDGKLRRIAPKILTDDLYSDPDVIILNNIYDIVGKYYPGAILSHRSAIEFQPHDNTLYFTHKYTKRKKFPGLTIQFMKGQGPSEYDSKFMNDNVFLSSTERSWLENLQTSRNLDKCIPVETLEQILTDIIVKKGVDQINKHRDLARIISEQLGMVKEFKKLDKIIGALLSTHPINELVSDPAVAIALGQAYDPARFELFQILFSTLKRQTFVEYGDNRNYNQYQLFSIFESYFSNYVEGTKFTVEEAIEIIESQVPIPTRKEDSHDVLGVYEMVSDNIGMKNTPQNPEDLIEILQNRHNRVMKNRPNINPGAFKTKNNQTGSLIFVEPSLVKGTLKKGFQLYEHLEPGFKRASFIMFLITEVHPFTDGNGRIARIMMNAEFHANGYSHILIPTSYRTDYLAGMRRLSNAKDPRAYIRMLETIYEFSSKVNGSSIEDMTKFLAEHNAFSEEEDIILKRV